MSTELNTVINIETKEEKKVDEPSMYAIIFLNDDFTPFDFVITVLVQLFNYTTEKAEHLAREIHNSGQSTVGTFTKDVAETKTLQVNNIAQEYEHPLKAITMEINS